MPLKHDFVEYLLGQGVLPEDKSLDLGKHSEGFHAGQPYTHALVYTGNSHMNLTEKFGQ